MLKKLFTFFAALTLSVGLWAADYYVPITIDASTLNGDVVMGKNQTKDAVWAAGHASIGLDGYACFYSNDCSYATDLDHGLPASVNVPNPDGVEVPFNFAWTGSGQFDGFDAIHLVSNGEAVTVDFKGGNAFKGLYFLATAGNVEGSSSPITVTVTYLDNTSKVSNFNILDWYYNGTKPTNAIQQFYRWSINNFVDYASNGPCLYCLSLNDALDPLKPIKSLTFTQANSTMCTAIFAITGILNGCTPKAPENTAGIYDGNTTQITFNEVTQDLDGNTISDDVTYVYDVARDPNFIMMLEGHTNQPLTCTVSGGTVTGTINAYFKGLYIRVRAKNSCGVSLNSDVIVDDAADYYMVTIPDSADYSVPDYVPNARYLSGDNVSFTAQLLADGKDLVGWKNIHGTSMSTSAQVSFVITQDTTILPNLKPEEREFTLTTGVTARMGTLDKDYPWIKTTKKPGLAYMSSNYHVEYSKSHDTLIITPESGVYYRLTFDYAVSSNYGDEMSIWVNDEKIVNEISGEQSGSYDSRFAFLTESGLPATIVMKFNNIDYYGGDDRGYIYNIQVQTYDTPPAVYTVNVLENTEGVVTGLAANGKYVVGDEVSLTAIPNELGFELREWQDGNGNPISTSNPLSFTITQDTTIKPIFQAEQRTYEIATGVTAQMGTLNKNLPWLKTTAKPGLAYMSATGHDDQDSRDTLIITPAEGISYRVKFDYAVSSEEDWDMMSIWVNDEKIVNEISGEQSGSYDSGETLLTKPDTIILSYHKDYSYGEGDDRGYIYNIVVTIDAPQVYTRTVTNGDWGTICLPWASVALEGGTFYDVLGTKDAELGVALTPIEEPDQLEAGKPYVFKATSEQIKVTYYPSTEVEDEVAGNNIIGSFNGCDVPEGKYIIVNNLLYKTADATSTIAANRAYFDVDAMGEYTPSQAPGRKVVFMGGRTMPTELESVDGSQCTMHNGKFIMNGRFVIVRDGKMYNALGM